MMKLEPQSCRRDPASARRASPLSRLNVYSINCTIVLIAALVGGCEKRPGESSAESGLYHLEISEKNPQGNDFVMTLQELRRDEKTSTVKVTRSSGASVPSVMFVVRGCYDIAIERNALYFINLEEWTAEDGGWMYVIGYSNEKPVDPRRYFGLPAPASKAKAYTFSAVKDYDRLFRDNH